MRAQAWWSAVLLRVPAFQQETQKRQEKIQMILPGFIKHMTGQVSEHSKENTREDQGNGSFAQLCHFLDIFAPQHLF